ncbi:ATP-binding cassette domain-containing protein [Micromonospora sp. NPDC049900]|uniref:ATP-binding cassette domain-containing protein n=1 Tax=Micromonospora sp. NPDC049900 TaxID=3364275 RepID=UPI0037BB1507
MIRAEGLTKTFRRYEREPGVLGSLRTLFSRRHTTVTAVDEVSFEVSAGTRVAYLGANGAGKSTTVKLLTGVTTPTRGRCTVDGIEPHRDRVRNSGNIGVVFGHRSQLWWDLSVPDSFRILKHIYDIDEAVYRRNLSLFRELLDIDALGNTPIRELSLGQRMRAEIAASLLHTPAVVFWDEPTIGLDLVLKEAVRELANQINREHGTTIFLTSHDISDISAICDQVLVVDQGRIVHQGTLAALLRTARHRAVHFDHRGDESPEQVAGRIEEALTGTTVSVDDQQRVTIGFPVDRLTAREVLTWVLHHFDVTDCFAPEPDLQTVLREIYGARQPAEHG